MSDVDEQIPVESPKQRGKNKQAHRNDDHHSGKGKGKGGGGGKSKTSGSTKLRGLDRDSADVRVSKTLSWLLRHGALKEGLPMRPDGYVKVDDLLDHPKLRAVSLNFNGVQEIVKADAKQRYDLRFEFDAEKEGTVESNELNQPAASGSWWIKANQGHSIKTVAVEMKPITSVEDIPTGIAVHGTNWKAWELIQKQGLSKMNRNHIHLAQGISTDNVVSGMRKGSSILIFVDIQKALDAGIKFELSDNGVVLTPGDEFGFLKPEFFARVENAKRQPVPGWEGKGPINAQAVSTKEPPKPTGEGYQTPTSEPPTFDTLKIDG